MNNKKRLDVALEPELSDRLDKFCVENKISKPELVKRLLVTILNNADTSEAEKNLYLIWIDNSLKDIIKKIAKQNAEIDCLRTEVREALKELKK
jgi:metal-responsive CopG/Arc/MetJ family transcriptional regulator